MKFTIEELEREARDAGNLARAVILSDQDDLLGSLLKWLAFAARKLAALQEDRGLEDAEIEEIRDQVADLTTQIQTRSEGVLLGLITKMAAPKLSLYNLRRGVDSLAQNSE